MNKTEWAPLGPKEHSNRTSQPKNLNSYGKTCLKFQNSVVPSNWEGLHMLEGLLPV
jgi:hypothetical protein